MTLGDPYQKYHRPRSHRRRDPDRPDLEAPFAFMQEYMSVTRSTPPQTPTAQ
jgi:hypothetical protein